MHHVVPIKFFAIALLEPTTYKISMPVSFLEYLTHHFQRFAQAEFHVQENPIQLAKFFNLYLKKHYLDN